MFDLLEADEAGLVDEIARLERVKAAAAAAQARVTAALVQRRRAAEAAAGIPRRKQLRGLASEVGLARRDSPHRGGRHLGFATALVFEMPYTLAALECGALSEWRATLIVRESACLSIEDRRTLDAELCADIAGLAGMGDKRITAAAKTIAYRLDPQAVVERAAKAAAERTVTIRPAPDAMAYLTVLLPVAQGVGVYAACKRAADTTFDGRTRGQIMADTLVERVTGRPAEAPTDIAVNLVLTDDTLLAGHPEPAHLDNYGPIPAAIARQLITHAVADQRSKTTLRRLYRRPAPGALIAMESRARHFPTTLARFITLRDHTCRTPYCNAPIRHTDHAQPHHHRGPTSAHNGLGACEHCYYTKESPGWQVTTTTTENGTHTAQFITPTGHHYHSTAPPPPTPKTLTLSRIATHITINLHPYKAA